MDLPPTSPLSTIYPTPSQSTSSTPSDVSPPPTALAAATRRIRQVDHLDRRRPPVRPSPSTAALHLPIGRVESLPTPPRPHTPNRLPRSRVFITPPNRPVVDVACIVQPTAQHPHLIPRTLPRRLPQPPLLSFSDDEQQDDQHQQNHQLDPDLDPFLPDDDAHAITPASFQRASHPIHSLSSPPSPHHPLSADNQRPRASSVMAQPPLAKPSAPVVVDNVSRVRRAVSALRSLSFQASADPAHEVVDTAWGQAPDRPVFAQQLPHSSRPRSRPPSNRLREFVHPQLTNTDRRSSDGVVVAKHPRFSTSRMGRHNPNRYERRSVWNRHSRHTSKQHPDPQGRFMLSNPAVAAQQGVLAVHNDDLHYQQQQLQQQLQQQQQQPMAQPQTPQTQAQSNATTPTPQNVDKYVEFIHASAAREVRAKRTHHLPGKMMHVFRRRRRQVQVK